MNKENYINREQLIELNKLQQINIASHTHSHKILTRIDSHELERELKLSKQTLEKILDVEVDSICFPLGNFSQSIVSSSKLVGYNKCYSSLPGFYCDDFIGVRKRSLVQFAKEREFKAILKGGDHFLFFWYKIKHYNI